MTNCPYCDNPIALTRGAPESSFGTLTPTTGTRHWNFESAVPAVGAIPTAPPPVFSEARRESPARPASVESDVMVPGAQALATGAAFCVIAIPITIYFHLHWTTPLTVLAIGTAGTWMILLGAHRRLLWTVETIINRDIDGDGKTGNPKPARVEVAIKEHRHTQMDDLPGPVDALREFAHDIHSGRVTFSERGARKSGYGATAFKELRTIFITRGWATWTVPGESRQGVKLTAKGRAVMHGLSEVE